MNGFKFDNRTGKISFNDAEVIDATSPVVSSVNGKTGSVTLVAEDLNAYTKSEVVDLLATKVDASALASVATTGKFEDLSDVPTFADTYYVAANGDDSEGTGAWNKPMKTLAGAQAQAIARTAANKHAVIVVLPGTYPDATVLTRPKMMITGLSGQMFNTNIGPVSFSASTDGGGVDGTSLGIERISISNTITPAIPSVDVSGVLPVTLMMNDVRIYNNKAGAKGIKVNVTNAVKSKVRLNLVDINTKAANATAIDMTNANGFANTVYIDSATGYNLEITDGQLTMAACSLEGKGDRIALIGDAGHMFFLNGILRNNKVDADVIAMSANGILTLMDTVVLTEGTNGSVITGDNSATVRYNNVTFGSPTNGTFSTKVDTGINLQQFANAFTQ